MEDMREMSIIQHLDKLRYRLFMVVGIVLVVSVVSFSLLKS